MKYKYHDFTSNRSIEDAVAIFNQRLNDAKYIYKKHNKNFKMRNCPICGSEKYEKFDLFHEMYGIDKCLKCSSTFVNPTPSIEALADYYENCLCNRQLSKVIKDRYTTDDLINDDRVQLILKVIENSQSTKKSIRILEVGCNNGAFLSKLRQALEINYPNNSFELFGVDIDPVAIRNPVDDKINLFQGFAEDIANEHENEYDMILHFELIEHLINPSSFVCSIYKMLVANGYMIFTTPNIKGLDNQALGFNNTRFLAHALFPPMHLNAFSTENIIHFLIANGFSVSEISTPGKFDVDMLTKCNEDLDNEVFMDIAMLNENYKALIQELIVELNSSSHMQCIARK